MLNMAQVIRLVGWQKLVNLFLVFSALQHTLQCSVTIHKSDAMVLLYFQTIKVGRHS